MPDYECGYCGRVAAATDDHIPAKNLFTGTLDTALPTVKSCASCNVGASIDDEYFRDVVLKYHRVSGQQAAQPLIAKMLRAAGKPEKQAYARATIAEFRQVELTTPAGIFLGMQDAFAPDMSRLDRVVGRYVRGLHRYHLGSRVPEDSRVRVVLNPDLISERHAEFTGMFRGGEAAVIQRGVFQYAWKTFGTPVLRSYWLLVFFDVLPILAAVRPQGEAVAPAA